ncbi:Photolyase/cryptochrome alpha/beta domain-containing protein [Psidium guajava]|nr:Photolyase/cryptochrome alpha/beta domain-containing protein [Psidium guajava]
MADFSFLSDTDDPAVEDLIPRTRTSASSSKLSPSTVPPSPPTTPSYSSTSSPISANSNLMLSSNSKPLSRARASARHS